MVKENPQSNPEVFKKEDEVSLEDNTSEMSDKDRQRFWELMGKMEKEKNLKLEDVFDKKTRKRIGRRIINTDTKEVLFFEASEGESEKINQSNPSSQIVGKARDKGYGKEYRSEIGNSRVDTKIL